MTKLIALELLIAGYVGTVILFLSVANKLKQEFNMYARVGNICYVDIDDRMYKATILKISKNRDYVRVQLDLNELISVYSIKLIYPHWMFDYKSQRMRTITIRKFKLNNNE